MENQYIIPSYGRKRHRGLSDAQKNDIHTLYKLYGINDPEKDIPEICAEKLGRKVVLEIGFGNGELLLQQANLHPDMQFIGCDPFENGVVTMLRDIHGRNLQNVHIFKGDARLLLEKLPEQSLRDVYVLFPDPWKKRRHHKRRLLSSKFINKLMQKLSAAGNLMVATDHEGYMLEILANLRTVPNARYCGNKEGLTVKPHCYPGETKYERKALDSGRKCYYLQIRPIHGQQGTDTNPLPTPQYG
ncbi:MAG: tRNA (guanosine(46)-N7)-methyltransferase TrmB [Holosporaceae bacterium]|jgi:tRNA (guanine-N7-)-methyltransferase|nr:tRNA (guanosine(46)-N7)-methyltransferase TrmB [Holosporaceae bacterium]